MKILGFLCVSEWSCHGLENPGDEKTAGWDRRPKAGFKDERLINEIENISLSL